MLTTYPLPENERERLAAMREYDILDTEPEVAFDRIASLAARVLKVPVALVSIMDAERQWFKACFGVDVHETGRDIAFCTYVIASDEVMIVPDTTKDPRFVNNPLVTGPLNVRFYAGVPLRMPGGFSIGTLCIVDMEPREFSPEEIAILSDLAELVVDELKLRQSERNYRSLIENTSDLVTVLDAGAVIRYESPSIERMLGYKPHELIGKPAFDYIHPDDKAGVQMAFKRAVQDPDASRLVEFRFRHRDGSWRSLEAAGVNRLHDPTIAGLVINSRDLTERKRIEETLRESEERFKSAFSFSATGMGMMTPDGHWLRVNRALCSMLGYTEEELLQMTFQEITHPDDLDAHLNHIRRTIAGEQATFRMEKRYFHKDGHIVWVQINVSLVRNEDDAPLYLVTQVQDISRRRHTEEQLRLLQSAVVNSTDAIFIKEIIPGDEIEVRIVYANEAFTRMTGYMPEEVIGKSPHILHEVDTAREARQKAHLTALAGQPADLELVYSRKDGTTFWAYVSIVPVLGENGSYTHLVSVMRDITERRKADEAVRGSEARKTAIVETALDCIISMDAEGLVVEWNPAAEKTFGFSRAEAMGRELGEMIVPPALRERHRSGLAHYLATGEGPVLGHRLELPALRADGSEIFVELAINRIPIEGPPLFTAYLRDITERRQSEADLVKAKEEADFQRESAERANAAKSEFLSRMSHELRTPLNAILGFGQLLEVSELVPDDEESVEQILRAGHHLLELINEVLEISRIEAGHLTISSEPISVNEICLEALDLVRPLCSQKGIRFDEAAARATDLWIMADRQRLKQVLLNLLSNAIKYNRDGGQVAIAIEPDGEDLRLAVKDTGWGIEASKMDRLFTPFDRLGAEQSGIEGTGMGLSLSRRLVEAMGGSMDVESIAGEGSTFWVNLPRAENPLAGLAEENDETGGSEGARPTNTRWVVLYIEDNLSNLQLIQRILARRPEIKLLTAMQGGLGLELARQHSPDLILLDLNLPDMLGEEALHHLHEDNQTKGIPVIVVSADATPKQVQRLLAAGAEDYLTKPLDMPLFLRTLDERLIK